MAHSYNDLSCSFCGKRQADVKKMIAGPTVCICNECVVLCNDIIAEKTPDAAARGTVQHIAAQPEDTLNVLAFVQQHCDGRPVDSVTVGELITKRRALNEERIAKLHREREEHTRSMAREEQTRNGFEYINLDACVSAEGCQQIHGAISRLNVDRQWCVQHRMLPFALGDHADGITVASPQPAPGDQYEAVFHARVRAGFVLGAAPFDIQYCDPDAFDRVMDIVFGVMSAADADNHMRDALRKIPDNVFEREIGVLGKPHQR